MLTAWIWSDTWTYLFSAKITSPQPHCSAVPMDLTPPPHTHTQAPSPHIRSECAPRVSCRCRSDRVLGERRLVGAARPGQRRRRRRLRPRPAVRLRLVRAPRLQGASATRVCALSSIRSVSVHGQLSLRETVGLFPTTRLFGLCVGKTT